MHNTITAVATDNAGNTSTSSPSVIDQVDATGPTVGTPTQSASINWNKSRSDTITVSASDTVSGVKSVEIYDGAKDIGAATQIGTSNNWTFTATGLADGPHTFTATATDNAGNTGTSAAGVTDKVDASGPDLQIGQTPGATTWNKSTSDTITVSVSDAFNGVSSLSLAKDGASAALTPQLDGTYVFNATGLSDGVHTFTATATDSLGNVSTKTITDAVDNTAPVVSTLVGSPSGWSNSANETITGTVTDGASGVANVAIYENDGVNNVWVGSTAVDASGNFTFVKAGLTEGAYTFTAKATDNAGNVSTASSPTVTDKVDLTAPVVSAIAQSASGTPTTSKSDTISVTAIDTGGSGVKSVEIYDGAKDLGAATLINGSWGYTANGLADGTHTFGAVVTDNAGNASLLASSPTVTDQVAGGAPVVSTIGDSEPKPWTKSTSDTITVTSTSANTYVGGYLRQRFKNRIRYGSGSSWVYNAIGLKDGVHTFAAVATDNVGASTLASSKTVVDQVDTKAPTIGSPSQSASGAWTKSNSDTITVAAGDIGGSGIASVEIFEGTKDWGTATLNNGSYVLHCKRTLRRLARLHGQGDGQSR